MLLYYCFQCGDTFIQLYTELCKYAINIDKGNIEREKSIGTIEEVKRRKLSMSKTCVRMAFMLKEYDFRISRICGLTAFTMDPTTDNLNLVNKLYWTIKNTSAVSRNSKIDIATVYEIERLLGQMRPDSLNPDYSWKQLIPVCKKYKQECDLLKNSAQIKKTSLETITDPTEVPAGSSLCSPPVISIRPSALDPSKPITSKDIEKAHVEKLLSEKNLSRDQIEKILSKQFPRNTSSDLSNKPALDMKQLGKTIDALKKSIYTETYFRESLEKNLSPLASRKKPTGKATSSPNSVATARSTVNAKLLHQQLLYGKHQQMTDHMNQQMTDHMNQQMTDHMNQQMSPPNAHVQQRRLSTSAAPEGPLSPPAAHSSARRMSSPITHHPAILPQRSQHPIGKATTSYHAAAGDPLVQKIQSELQRQRRDGSTFNILRPPGSANQECAKIAQQIAEMHEKQRAAERERLERARLLGKMDAAKAVLNTNNVPSKSQISDLLSLTFQGNKAKPDQAAKHITPKSPAAATFSLKDAIVQKTYGASNAVATNMTAALQNKTKVITHGKQRFCVTTEKNMAKLNIDQHGRVNIGNSKFSVQPVMSLTKANLVQSLSGAGKSLPLKSTKAHTPPQVPTIQNQYRPPASHFQGNTVQHQSASVQLTNQPDVLTGLMVNSQGVLQTSEVRRPMYQNLDTLASASLSISDGNPQVVNLTGMQPAQQNQQQIQPTTVMQAFVGGQNMYSGVPRVSVAESVLAAPLYSVPEPQLVGQPGLAQTTRSTPVVLPVEQPVLQHIVTVQNSGLDYSIQQSNVQNFATIASTQPVGQVHFTQVQTPAQNTIMTPAPVAQNQHVVTAAPDLSPAMLQQILSTLKQTVNKPNNEHQGPAQTIAPNIQHQAKLGTMGSAQQAEFVRQIVNTKPEHLNDESVIEATKKIIELRQQYKQSDDQSVTSPSAAPVNTSGRNFMVRTDKKSVGLLQRMMEDSDQTAASLDPHVEVKITETANVSGNVPDLPDLGAQEFHIDELLSLDNDPNLLASSGVSTELDITGTMARQIMEANKIARNMPDKSTYANANRIAKEREMGEKAKGGTASVCTPCGRTFTCKEALQSHMSSSSCGHTNEMVTCQHCGRQLKHQKSLKTHQRKTCRVLLGKQLETKPDAHKMSNQINPTAAIIPSTGEQLKPVVPSPPILKCSSCKIFFRNELVLKAHLDSGICAPANQPTYVPNVTKTLNESKPASDCLKCDICELTFKSISGMKEHVKAGCINPKHVALHQLKDYEFKTVYKCCACTFMHGNIKVVYKHMEMCQLNVTNERPLELYKCCMCGEVFDDKEKTCRHVSKQCPKLKPATSQRQAQQIYDRLKNSTAHLQSGKDQTRIKPHECNEQRPASAATVPKVAAIVTPLPASSHVQNSEFKRKLSSELSISDNSGKDNDTQERSFKPFSAGTRKVENDRQTPMSASFQQDVNMSFASSGNSEISSVDKITKMTEMVVSNLQKNLNACEQLPTASGKTIQGEKMPSMLKDNNVDAAAKEQVKHPALKDAVQTSQAVSEFVKNSSHKGKGSKDQKKEKVNEKKKADNKGDSQSKGIDPDEEEFEARKKERTKAEKLYWQEFNAMEKRKADLRAKEMQEKVDESQHKEQVFLQFKAKLDQDRELKAKLQLEHKQNEEDAKAKKEAKAELLLLELRNQEELKKNVLSKGKRNTDVIEAENKHALKLKKSLNSCKGKDLKGKTNAVEVLKVTKKSNREKVEKKNDLIEAPKTLVPYTNEKILRRRTSNNSAKKETEGRFTRLVVSRHLLTKSISPQDMRKLRGLREKRLIKKRKFFDEVEPTSGNKGIHVNGKDSEEWNSDDSQSASDQEHAVKAKKDENTCRFCCFSAKTQPEGKRKFYLARHYIHIHRLGYKTLRHEFVCKSCAFKTPSTKCLQMHDHILESHKSEILEHVDKARFDADMLVGFKNSSQKLDDKKQKHFNRGSPAKTEKMKRHMRALALRSKCAEQLMKLSLKRKDTVIEIDDEEDDDILKESKTPALPDEKVKQESESSALDGVTQSDTTELDENSATEFPRRLAKRLTRNMVKSINTRRSGRRSPWQEVSEIGSSCENPRSRSRSSSISSILSSVSSTNKAAKPNLSNSTQSEKVMTTRSGRKILKVETDSVKDTSSDGTDQEADKVPTRRKSVRLRRLSERQQSQKAASSSMSEESSDEEIKPRITRSLARKEPLQTKKEELKTPDVVENIGDSKSGKEDFPIHSIPIKRKRSSKLFYHYDSDTESNDVDINAAVKTTPNSARRRHTIASETEKSSSLDDKENTGSKTQDRSDEEKNIVKSILVGPEDDITVAVKTTPNSARRRHTITSETEKSSSLDDKETTKAKDKLDEEKNTVKSILVGIMDDVIECSIPRDGLIGTRNNKKEEGIKEEQKYHIGEVQDTPKKAVMIGPDEEVETFSQKDTEEELERGVTIEINIPKITVTCDDKESMKAKQSVTEVVEPSVGEAITEAVMDHDDFALLKDKIKEDTTHCIKSDTASDQNDTLNSSGSAFDNEFLKFAVNNTHTSTSTSADKVAVNEKDAPSEKTIENLDEESAPHKVTVSPLKEASKLMAVDKNKLKKLISEKNCFMEAFARFAKEDDKIPFVCVKRLSEGDMAKVALVKSTKSTDILEKYNIINCSIRMRRLSKDEINSKTSSKKEEKQKTDNSVIIIEERDTKYDGETVNLSVMDESKEGFGGNAMAAETNSEDEISTSEKNEHQKMTIDVEAEKSESDSNYTSTGNLELLDEQVDNLIEITSTSGSIVAKTEISEKFDLEMNEVEITDGQESSILKPEICEELNHEVNVTNNRTAIELDPEISEEIVSEYNVIEISNDETSTVTQPDLILIEEYDRSSLKRPEIWEQDVSEENLIEIKDDSGPSDLISDMCKDSVKELTEENDGKDSVKELIEENDGKDSVKELTKENDGKDSVKELTEEDDSICSKTEICQENDGKDNVIELTEENDGKDNVIELTEENDGKDNVIELTEENDGKDNVIELTEDNGSICSNTKICKENGSKDNVIELTKDNNSICSKTEICIENDGKDNVKEVTKEDDSICSNTEICKENASKTIVIEIIKPDTFVEDIDEVKQMMETANTRVPSVLKPEPCMHDKSIEINEDITDDIGVKLEHENMLTCETETEDKLNTHEIQESKEDQDKETNTSEPNEKYAAQLPCLKNEILPVEQIGEKGNGDKVKEQLGKEIVENTPEETEGQHIKEPEQTILKVDPLTEDSEKIQDPIKDNPNDTVETETCPSASHVENELISKDQQVYEGSDLEEIILIPEDSSTLNSDTKDNQASSAVVMSLSLKALQTYDEDSNGSIKLTSLSEGSSNDSANNEKSVPLLIEELQSDAEASLVNVSDGIIELGVIPSESEDNTLLEVHGNESCAEGATYGKESECKVHIEKLNQASVQDKENSESTTSDSTVVDMQGMKEPFKQTCYLRNASAETELPTEIKHDTGKVLTVSEINFDVDEGSETEHPQRQFDNACVGEDHKLVMISDSVDKVENHSQFNKDHTENKEIYLPMHEHEDECIKEMNETNTLNDEVETSDANPEVNDVETHNAYPEVQGEKETVAKESDKNEEVQTEEETVIETFKEQEVHTVMYEEPVEEEIVLFEEICTDLVTKNDPKTTDDDTYMSTEANETSVTNNPDQSQMANLEFEDKSPREILPDKIKKASVAVANNVNAQEQIQLEKLETKTDQITEISTSEAAEPNTIENIEINEKEETVKTFSPKQDDPNEVEQPVLNETDGPTEEEIVMFDEWQVVDSVGEEVCTTESETGNMDIPSAEPETVVEDTRAEESSENVDIDKRKEESSENVDEDKRKEESSENVDEDKREEESSENMDADKREEESSENVDIDKRKEESSEHVDIDKKKEESSENVDIDKREEESSGNVDEDKKTDDRYLEIGRRKYHNNITPGKETIFADKDSKPIKETEEETVLEDKDATPVIASVAETEMSTTVREDICVNPENMTSESQSDQVGVTEAITCAKEVILEEAPPSTHTSDEIDIKNAISSEIVKNEEIEKKNDTSNSEHLEMFNSEVEKLVEQSQSSEEVMNLTNQFDESTKIVDVIEAEPSVIIHMSGPEQSIVPAMFLSEKEPEAVNVIEPAQKELTDTLKSESLKELSQSENGEEPSESKEIPLKLSIPNDSVTLTEAVLSGEITDSSQCEEVDKLVLAKIVTEQNQSKSNTEPSKVFEVAKRSPPEEIAESIHTAEVTEDKVATDSEESKNNTEDELEDVAANVIKRSPRIRNMQRMDYKLFNEGASDKDKVVQNTEPVSKRRRTSLTTEEKGGAVARGKVRMEQSTLADQRADNPIDDNNKGNMRGLEVISIPRVVKGDQNSKPSSGNTHLKVDIPKANRITNPYKSDEDHISPEIQRANETDEDFKQRVEAMRFARRMSLVKPYESDFHFESPARGEMKVKALSEHSRHSGTNSEGTQGKLVVADIDNKLIKLVKQGNTVETVMTVSTPSVKVEPGKLRVIRIMKASPVSSELKKIVSRAHPAPVTPTVSFQKSMITRRMIEVSESSATLPSSSPQKTTVSSLAVELANRFGSAKMKSIASESLTHRNVNTRSLSKERVEAFVKSAKEKVSPLNLKAKNIVLTKQSPKQQNANSLRQVIVKSKALPHSNQTESNKSGSVSSPRSAKESATKKAIFTSKTEERNTRSKTIEVKPYISVLNKEKKVSEKEPLAEPSKVNKEKKGSEKEPSAEASKVNKEKKGSEKEPSAEASKVNKEKKGPEKEPSAEASKVNKEKKGPEKEPSAEASEDMKVSEKELTAEAIKVVNTRYHNNIAENVKEQKITGEKKEVAKKTKTSTVVKEGNSDNVNVPDGSTRETRTRRLSKEVGDGQRSRSESKESVKDSNTSAKSDLAIKQKSNPSSENAKTKIFPAVSPKIAVAEKRKSIDPHSTDAKRQAFSPTAGRRSVRGASKDEESRVKTEIEDNPRKAVSPKQTPSLDKKVVKGKRTVRNEGKDSNVVENKTTNLKEAETKVEGRRLRGNSPSKKDGSVNSQVGQGKLVLENSRRKRKSEPPASNEVEGEQTSESEKTTPTKKHKTDGTDTIPAQTENKGKQTGKAVNKAEDKDKKKSPVRQLIHGGKVFQIQKGSVTEFEIQGRTRGATASATMDCKLDEHTSPERPVAKKLRSGKESKRSKSFPHKSTIDEYISSTLKAIGKGRNSDSSKNWKVDQNTRKTYSITYKRK